MKCVLRTLFYQFLLLFVGASIGFITNAEWVGWKYPVVSNSIRNIFHQINFEDPGVLQWLYGNGRLKVFGVMGEYPDLEVIEEAMLAEEWYWVKFSYTDKNGNTKIDIKNVRIRWKPWEYYYDDKAREIWSEEDMRKYINEGTLNSRESDRAFRLMYELKDMKDNKIKT
tara:strand:+ start:516 stop:1022 length:507 start_codon:yes stop_codon:yes gene_type:complete